MALHYPTFINFKCYKTLWQELSLALLVQSQAKAPRISTYYIHQYRRLCCTIHLSEGKTKYRTGPHRTAPDPPKLGEKSPQPGKTMGRKRYPPLWVGIRNSAMTPNIEPRLEETSFTLPHRTPKPQKTTAPDPKKLAQGSPQPSQTMGSPGTLPLMDGHP